MNSELMFSFIFFIKQKFKHEWSNWDRYPMSIRCFLSWHLQTSYKSMSHLPPQIAGAKFIILKRHVETCSKKKKHLETCDSFCLPTGGFWLLLTSSASTQVNTPTIKIKGVQKIYTDKDQEDLFFFPPSARLYICLKIRMNIAIFLFLFLN